MTENDLQTLSGGRCPACGRAAHPLRWACRYCAAPLEPARLAASGKLQAWTTIRTPPAGFDGDYRIGYVTLDDGPRVLVGLGAVEDGPAPRIGDPVTVVAGDADATGVDGLVGRVATREPS